MDRSREFWQGFQTLIPSQTCGINLVCFNQKWKKIACWAGFWPPFAERNFGFSHAIKIFTGLMGGWTHLNLPPGLTYSYTSFLPAFRWMLSCFIILQLLLIFFSTIGGYEPLSNTSFPLPRCTLCIQAADDYWERLETIKKEVQKEYESNFFLLRNKRSLANLLLMLT